MGVTILPTTTCVVGPSEPPGAEPAAAGDEASMCVSPPLVCSTAEPPATAAPVLPLMTKSPPADNLCMLAEAFVARALDSTPVDPVFIFKALQPLSVYGKTAEFNACVGNVLHARGERSPFAEGADGYIRYVIGEALSGEDRERALSFLELGYDATGAADWAYRLEGVQAIFKELGEDIREHLFLTAAVTGAGGVAALGLATVSAPAALMAGGAFLAFGLGGVAYGLGKIVKNEIQARYFAASRAEHIRHLQESGRGIALTALSAPPAAGGASIMTGARQAMLAANAGRAMWVTVDIIDAVEGPGTAALNAAPAAPALPMAATAPEEICLAEATRISTVSNAAASEPAAVAAPAEGAATLSGEASPASGMPPGGTRPPD